MFLSRKSRSPQRPRPRINVLQWGRDVSIPEMLYNRVGHSHDHQASMGPGCFYPGNAGRGVETVLRAELQWGRNVSIPEMRWFRRWGRWSFRLQWGRNVSIPEMRRHKWRPCPKLGFNGAGMFPSRKFPLRGSRRPTSPRFNGAGMFPSRK